MSFLTYQVRDEDPQLVAFDFSEIPGVANNPHFAVRVEFQQGSGGTEGNNRFDGITLQGVPMEQVANDPPSLVDAEWPADGVVSLRAGGAALTLHANAMFDDPDGDPMSFTVHAGREDMVEVVWVGEDLVVRGLRAGESEVVIEANDGKNEPVSGSFRVLVHPEPFDLAGGAVYVLKEWDGDSPALTYPSHAIFLRGDRSDPDLSADLDRAYGIGAEEADRERDVDFPYSAESGTRINGLGESGFSFVNAGAARDLGGAVLALDTRGLTGGELEFTAATVRANDRRYAIRLQYRIGHEGPFADVVSGSSESVEYVSSTVDGDTMTFGPIALPEEALDREYVQLAWRYHHVDGDTGEAAEIRCDDIIVVGTTAASPDQDFAAWQRVQFPRLADLADPGISGPLADPYGFGLPNLARYALGISGQEDLKDRLPVLQASGDGSVAFRFRYDPAKTDIAWMVETSEDLRDWSETIFDSREDPGALPDEVGWLEVGHPGVGARGFYRLRVSRTGSGDGGDQP